MTLLIYHKYTISNTNLPYIKYSLHIQTLNTKPKYQCLPNCHLNNLNYKQTSHTQHPQTSKPALNPPKSPKQNLPPSINA